MSRLFSGVQPTGQLHLGNYLGAIRNWIGLQDQYQCVYCIVDLHAITVPQDPEQLRQATRFAAATYIAAGIDPEKSIIFNQSQVSGHYELMWLLSCMTPLGWLNRMTQFKEKAGKKKESASLGLYGYPVLMAADIMGYHATHVPVGEDQKQHLELVRDIASNFNSRFDIDFFPVPEPLIMTVAARIMSLRDGCKKMSKSDISEFSRINLADTADDIVQKFKKAKTDSEPLPLSEQELVDRPEAKNLVGIYAALSQKSISDVLVELNGAPFSDFKQKLTDISIATLDPMRQRIDELLGDQTELDQILVKGSVRAAEIMTAIVYKTRDIMGMLHS